MSDLFPARRKAARARRFVVLDELDADAVITLLDGFRELLVFGGLDASQLLLATGGRPVPGGDVAPRLAGVVEDAVRALHEGQR